MVVKFITVYEFMMNCCFLFRLVAEDENLVYAPEIDEITWEEDTVRSDHNWREPSGDVQRCRQLNILLRKKHNKIINIYTIICKLQFHLLLRI